MRFTPTAPPRNDPEAEKLAAILRDGLCQAHRTLESSKVAGSPEGVARALHQSFTRVLRGLERMRPDLRETSCDAEAVEVL